ncbi:DUF4907 domain-containing protein [Zobellia roscoffensis]
MKKIHFLLAVLVAVVAYIAFNFSAGEAKQKGLHSEVIEVGEGFGYQILHADKILVKQEFIPAIQGELPFNTEKEAQLIGDEVLKKIKKGEAPFITVSELKNLNITIQNQ